MYFVVYYTFVNSQMITMPHNIKNHFGDSSKLRLSLNIFYWMLTIENFLCLTKSTAVCAGDEIRKNTGAAAIFLEMSVNSLGVFLPLHVYTYTYRCHAITENELDCRIPRQGKKIVCWHAAYMYMCMC